MRGFACAALLALTACGVSAGDVPMIAGDYELIEVEGKEIFGKPTARIAPDGAISGQGPCNVYRSENSAELPALDYKTMVTTRRACIREGGETDFLAALGAVRQAERRGGELVMTGPGVTIRWYPLP
ncbi:META domain-containing protein [Paracoccus sp. MBLB3053]|uniref:META domain-containing protein n=1 Tax=Paracoccus aurantius TaxID=3073814 RepID=A0ABU2HMI1_9RHOB|nr:META domain-containing protein [Paracoccus sp. MBLB3053]MDS9465962.1 META domain-containing protein [Paracoccus sp. MBLB3053]